MPNGSVIHKIAKASAALRCPAARVRPIYCALGAKGRFASSAAPTGGCEMERYSGRDTGADGHGAAGQTGEPMPRSGAGWRQGAHYAHRAAVTTGFAVADVTDRQSGSCVAAADTVAADFVAASTRRALLNAAHTTAVTTRR